MGKRTKATERYEEYQERTREYAWANTLRDLGIRDWKQCAESGAINSEDRAMASAQHRPGDRPNGHVTPVMRDVDGVSERVGSRGFHVSGPVYLKQPGAGEVLIDRKTGRFMKWDGKRRILRKTLT